MHSAAHPSARHRQGRCAGRVRISLNLIRRALLLAATLLLLGGRSAAAASGWQAPLHPMTVTRPFEPPPTPYAAGHRGVDLAGAPGEEVVAAAAGLVSYAGPLAGRGVVVVVHGLLRTTYEPVQATVERGTTVTAGQLIGRLQAGHPGCPAIACLHWGLLRGQTYLDPLSVLGERQVRLLPPSGSLQAAFATTAARAPAMGALGAAGPVVNPGATWSLAALAGAGVVMVRRRR
jgi:murein DD-endopeptidase MepM/ murein hydrolase activator NlpD